MALSGGLVHASMKWMLSQWKHCTPQLMGSTRTFGAHKGKPYCDRERAG